MNEIFHRALVSITRGEDLRRVSLKSFALAVSSVIFALPYFHYMIFVVQDQGRFPEHINPWSFLCAELFSLFIICLLSSMVGFSFYKRYELPGLGNMKDLTNALTSLLTWALVMILLSYFLFDRFFIEISTVSYPKDALYLIILPFQGAFTDEIILRFCLLTISVGLFKHKAHGVVFVSAMAPIFTIKYFNFIGVKLDFGYLLITQFFLSFLSNLLLGYFYVTRGLLCSMALKFLFGLKYLVVSWVI